jgi:hypothetical protein
MESMDIGFMISYLYQYFIEKVYKKDLKAQSKKTGWERQSKMAV